ncbi:MAG: DUF4340 domain-containing protein [Alphaproteobacteria bacterium]|nr:DUF4340 domain-containing protein [Alphaproteobacteria bacterium]
MLALLAVTVVAVGLAVVSSLGGPSPQDSPLIGTLVLPDLGHGLQDIDRVTLVRGAQKVTLTRDHDRWRVEEKGGWPADPQRVRRLLLGLAELRYVEPKTRETRLYPRLAVEDAGKPDSRSTLVTVADAKGKLLGEIIAGKSKYDELGGGNDGLYLRKPGDARAWLARGSLDLSGDTTAWLDKTLIDLPATSIKEAEFTAADSGSVAILRDKAGDKFRLATRVPRDKKLKSEDALAEPAGALASLDFADVQPAAAFAFPATGVAHARFATFDGLTLTFDIADQGKTSWVRISAAGTGAAAARAQSINAKTRDWLFALPDYKIGLLKTTLAGLLAPAKSS